MTKSFELLTKDGRTDLATAADGALPVINRKVGFEGGSLIDLERPTMHLLPSSHQKGRMVHPLHAHDGMSRQKR